nr:DWARF open reading frame [Denticeps clupeoides]
MHAGPADEPQWCPWAQRNQSDKPREAMGQKATGQLDTSRLLVPILLMLGWIVGCAIVVYFVFS